MSVLNQAHFQEGTAAFESACGVIWPDGAVCPHRGSREKIHVFKGTRTKKNQKHPEGFECHGLKKCGKCLKPFTVWIGPVSEASHLPLRQWLQVFHLLCSGKKSIGSSPLAGVLEVKL